MKKIRDNIGILLLSAINLVVGILLIIFAFPNNIPTLFNFNEKIVCMGSKWLMILSLVIPTTFCLLAIFLQNSKIKKLFKALVVLSFYENMLIFTCFSLKDGFSIGELAEVPLSTFLFIPLSVLMMIYGLKIKHITYKSRFGIRTKATIETEFIWKQTHFYARNVIFATGFLLFVMSVISSFFHYFFIMIPIFAIAILIDFILIKKQADGMHKKYLTMKKRQEIAEQMKNNKSQTNKK